MLGAHIGPVVSARQFDRVLRVLDSWGYVEGWQLTEAGEMLTRLYSETDLHRLRFIRRARALGFDMKQVAGLLALWSDHSRASADVRELALQHAAALGGRIAQMQAMQRTLQALARRCHGDERPDCPILDDLGGEGTDVPGGDRPGDPHR